MDLPANRYMAGNFEVLITCSQSFSVKILHSVLSLSLQVNSDSNFGICCISQDSVTASIHLPVSVECPEISKEPDLSLYTNSMFLFPCLSFFTTFWLVTFLILKLFSYLLWPGVFLLACLCWHENFSKSK